jgi:hypothetical protein
MGLLALFVIADHVVFAVFSSDATARCKKMIFLNLWQVTRHILKSLSEKIKQACFVLALLKLPG